VAVLVDGREVGSLEPGGEIEVALGSDPTRLAVLPGVSFFTRYHEVFP
jgi:hypothetical protein